MPRCAACARPRRKAKWPWPTANGGICRSGSAYCDGCSPDGRGLTRCMRSNRHLMTEQEYAAIAAAGDRLLCAQDTSLARLAIPPLHVINEHPGCTSVYDPAAHRLADWEDFPRAALRAARAVVRSARRGREASGTRAPIDVLII